MENMKSIDRGIDATGAFLKRLAESDNSVVLLLFLSSVMVGLYFLGGVVLGLVYLPLSQLVAWAWHSSQQLCVTAVFVVSMLAGWWWKWFVLKGNRTCR
ncbi:MAG TPA: hypothetical protein VN420_01150 [Candidatus Fimivivens sp.]|nr:hypothetical protein [Candidatus Fimivivens sp.]